jgi:glycoside/pentoside/hexuronide:cation symporter, GPH family
VGNWPWRVLCLVAFLTLANVGVRNAAALYYFKYNVGDEQAFTLFGTLGMLAFIAGAFATKLFTRRWSRRSLMIVLMAINGLAMASFFLADPKNLPLLHALNIVGSFAAGPTPAIVWSMYADTADYGEWKFGRRATGLVFAAVVFVQKVGLALGSAVLGWALAGYGFVANAAQTPESLFGIKLMFSIVPGALAFLSGMAVFFYRLDEPQVKQIEQDLATRNKSVAPESTVSLSATPATAA